MNTVDGVAAPRQTSLFFLNNLRNIWLGIAIPKAYFATEKAVINENHANKDSFIDVQVPVAEAESKVEDEELNKIKIEEIVEPDTVNRESFVNVGATSIVESVINEADKPAVEEDHIKEPFVDVIGLKDGLKEDAPAPPSPADEKIEEPFEEVKVEEDVEENPILDILGNSSLVKKIIKKGVKDQRPKNGQICTISFKTRLDEEIIEDKLSYQFILGDADVVPALDIAVSLMNLNEECELKSEPRHAYGDKGDAELKIPANATLMFNVTLEKIENFPDLKILDTIERLSIA